MRARPLILATVLLGAIISAVFAGREPPDTPERIAKECRFIADREAARMVRQKDYGPVPFGVWRATGRTGGAPPPIAKGLPWEIRLLTKPSTKRPTSIDCSSALDEARVPRAQMYNDGPPQQAYRLQYSRITFSHGGRFAMARITTCRMEHNMWDERSRIAVWRRRGETWEPVNDDITLEYTYPGRKLPMQCFHASAT